MSLKEDNLNDNEIEKSTEWTEDDDVDIDFDLFQKLTDCCEKAYADGIDSADIYKALHSASLLLSGENSRDSEDSKILNVEIKATKNTKDCKLMNSKSLRLFFKLMRSFRKASIALVFLISAAFLLHLTVCSVFFKVNPFQTMAIFFPDFLHLKDTPCLLPSHPLIMEMVRPVLNCEVCQNSEGGSPIIRFDSRPTKEEFLKVAYSSKPIIVNGGALASKMPISFNFSKLKEIFESEPGGVESVSEECQFLPLRSTFQTFREALEAISNFTYKEGAKPWYIGWSNCHPGVAEKLRVLFPRPDFLPENSESSAIDWIFIGSPGLGAAMHIDYVRRPSWQAQLSGSKRWILRPPPDCEDVCPDEISFTIHPGDLLFLETNSWYHETFIEKDELSISIGSEYD